MESSQRGERSPIIQYKEIPYQPPQVSMTDVDGDGRLIPIKTSSIIRKRILGNLHHLGRYGVDIQTGGKLSKKALRKDFKIDTKFSLLITNHNNKLKAFAIYGGVKKNKHLGKGSMGTVKVIQDIETGEFYAAKFQTQKNTHQDLSELVLRETNQLDCAGKLVAYTTFESKSRPDRRTHVIIMPLLPGTESRLLISQRKSPLQILDFCNAVTDAVCEIHARGILHRDLKTENIIYDLINGKAGVIDFGHATTTNHDLVSTTTQLYGSPLYMPPEIFAQYLAWKENKNTEIAVTYSEKTEVYCLGLVFARFFKLIKRVGKKDAARCMLLDPYKDTKGIANSTPIPNETRRQEVIYFLQQMTAPIPEGRPSMQVVQKFFQDIRQAIRSQDENTSNCAVIDIKEFIELQGCAKEKYIESLLPFDEIQLVHCRSEFKMPIVTRIHNELSAYGFAVRNTLVYHSVDFSDAMQMITKNAGNEHIPSTYHEIHPDRFEKNTVKTGNPTQIISPPPQVDEQDLGSDGRLISIKMLHDLKQAMHAELAEIRCGDAVRISKCDIINKYGIKCPYSVVAHRNEHDEIQLFAIYRGVKSNKHLGTGQHGVIKLIQDLQTTAFHALKLTAAFANEDKLLQESGDLIAKYSYEPRSTRNRNKYAPRHGSAPPTINALITRLAKGVTIDTINITNAAQLCKVLLGMVTATKQLHDRNILHNDIKPDQFLFDEINNIVKLVDLGNAYNFGDNAVLKRVRGKSFRYGTSVYSYKQTPHIDVNKHVTRHDLLKVDIYALGISMAQVAGLLGHDYNLVDLDSDIFQKNGIIPDGELRQSLWELLYSMTNANWSHRPDISAVFQACSLLTEKINKKVAASELIGIIDINKFKSCSDTKRKKLADKASCVDSVVFVVNQDGEISTQNLAMAKKIFEKAGASVKDRVVTMPQPSAAKMTYRRIREELLRQLQILPGIKTTIRLLNTPEKNVLLPSISSLVSSLFTSHKTQHASMNKSKTISNDDTFKQAGKRNHKAVS